LVKKTNQPRQKPTFSWLVADPSQIQVQSCSTYFFFQKILFCLRQGGQIACTIESSECFGTKVQKNAGINAGISVHLYDGALGKAEFAAELPVPIKLCKLAP
jgi:hypothetical protein